MISKKWTLGFALLGLGLGLVACTGSKTQNATLRLRLPAEPPTLDWTLAADNISKDVIINLQEGLVEHDDQTQLGPAHAESWKLSDDGRTYTFKLRTGLLWSDGQPLLAQHFVDGWERVLNPKTASEYAYFLYEVEGARDYHTGKVSDFSKVGAKALAPDVFEVRLVAPISFWAHMGAFWTTYPVRKDLIEKHGDRWTDAGKLVSNGPYVLKEWARDSKIVLEKNPHYWDKKVLETMPPQVEFRVVKDGSVAVSLFDTQALDIVRDLPPVQLQTLSKRPEFKASPYLRGTYIGFNVSDPQVKDVRVRRALAHATNREEIARAFQPTVTQTNSWIPEGLLGANQERGLGFDPEKAKALWKELGDQAPKELELWYDQNERYKILAENVQNQWTRVLGVPVKLNSQEWKVYLKRLATQAPPLWRLGWGADYPDADTFMNLFTCNSGSNHTRFCHARYDELVTQASRSNDESVRSQAYNEAQKILLEDQVAIIPVFDEQNMHLVSQRVTGFHANLIGYFLIKRLRLQ